ncbi:MAG: 50S ribosomal protein L13 [Patescibacteria group bacterium]
MSTAYTTHTLDAAGKSIGRVASAAAKLLRGKAETSFANHIEPRVKVSIVNASKIEVSERKLDGKVYLHYSGYPGGQKAFTLAEMIARKGYGEVFKKAVYGMLPDNKLSDRIIKNLTVLD